MPQGMKPPKAVSANPIKLQAGVPRTGSAGAHDSLIYSFNEDGPLGIAFVGQTSQDEHDHGQLILVVGSVVEESLATKVAPDLEVGMVLERVGTEKIKGKTYKEVLECIRKYSDRTKKPLKLCFEADRRKGRVRAPSEDLLRGVQARMVRPASPTAHLHDPWKNGKDTYRHIVLSEAALSDGIMIAVWLLGAVLVGCTSALSKQSGGIPSVTGARAVTKPFGSFDEFMEHYLAKNAGTAIDQDCRMVLSVGAAFVILLACVSSSRLLTLLSFMYAATAGFLACGLLAGLDSVGAEVGISVTVLLITSKLFTDTVRPALLISLLYGGILFGASRAFPASRHLEHMAVHPTYSLLGELAASGNMAMEMLRKVQN